MAGELAALDGLGSGPHRRRALGDRTVLVLCDIGLHVTIRVVTSDPALTVRENRNPVPGGVGGLRRAWMLYLPSPGALDASVAGAAKRSCASIRRCRHRSRPRRTRSKQAGGGFGQLTWRHSARRHRNGDARLGPRFRPMRARTRLRILADVILGSIADILGTLGIDPTRLFADWSTDQAAISNWIGEGSLKCVALECHRPERNGESDLRVPGDVHGQWAGGSEIHSRSGRAVAKYSSEVAAGYPMEPAYRLFCSFNGPHSVAGGMVPRNESIRRRHALGKLRYAGYRTSRARRNALLPKNRWRG